MATSTTAISTITINFSTSAATYTTVSPEETTTSKGKESNTCEGSDTYCNPAYLLVSVILLVLLIYIILALVRILLCFVYRRRQQTTSQIERVNREIEEIGHPFSYLSDRGFDNNAFVDPPPRYEQLFKRDEPPPIYETPAMQRRAGNFSRQPSASSITSAPPTCIQSGTIIRTTSRSSLPTGVFGTSVPAMTTVIIDESSRSRNSTLDSEDGFTRPELLVPSQQDPPPASSIDATSPTREHLI